MTEVLSKLAEQITVSDIQALIDLEVPESDRLDYKESLSTTKQFVDPWMQNKDRIGRDARNSLLREGVAFANAYGGVLILGMRDSNSEPPVATQITPVQRCQELASRLKLIFRDCVEPQLPRTEIFAIPTDGNRGVVVIRVGQSRLAPHRVKPTLSCPIRRADRSEEMTMREIQDMTINMSHGLERLERSLSKRSERFEQEFQRLANRNQVVGVRATAVPVGDDIRYDRVIRQHRIIEGLEEPWREVLLRWESGNTRSLGAHMINPIHWRPMLRSARAELSYDSDDNEHLFNSYREIHCGGLVEAGFVSGPVIVNGNHELTLLFDWPAVLFANSISQAHRLRMQAGVPLAEYAVEVEISVKGVEAIVPRGGIAPPLGKFNLGQTDFPLYSLGDIADVPNLLNLFHRDFYNSIGRDFEFEQAQITIEGWPIEISETDAEDPS